MKAFLGQLRELVEQTDLVQKPFYLLRLEALMKRLEDPQMKLAIIGNFSSGKSTFLNALLGQRLLSMANIPTTAVPTWIDWEAAGGQTRVWVRTLDGIMREVDKDGRQQLQQLTGIRIPEELGPMVDYLTTSTELLSVISQVRVSFPARQELRGFVLIDTPGVNPGAVANAGHIIGTQNVLRDEADAAIVLFPCHSVFTRQFSEFMEENASHLMDDSIFILTKMDMVDSPREREQLVWFVRENVAVSFDLDSPQVYACSAGRALDFRISGDPGAKDWAEAFSRMNREIFASLDRRRIDTAARRISSLVKQLLEDLTEAVAERERTLVSFRNNLESFSLENFQGQVSSLTLDYSANAALRRLLASRSDPERTIGSGRQALHRGIQEAVSKKQLNVFLDNQARKILSQMTEQVIAQTHAVVDDYESGWKQAFGALENTLYSELNTYTFFLDSIPGCEHRDIALDLPNTLTQIRLDMDASLRKARQILEQPRKKAQTIAKGAWLPVNSNPVGRMMGTMQDHRTACQTATDRVLDDLRESFRLSAMEAAELLYAGDSASAKLLSQLYVQNFEEQFRLKQPDLEAYQSALASRLEAQRATLEKLKAMELELAWRKEKTKPEEEKNH